ncbi:M24 family metallopeptidase [Desulfitobacterium chlororespirans]|uniref:Xaa-Pro aminopeptidase n=1 Tax=Desulfitobacterium chlororespirans DSM 11544 TaxID=1121395 RepID=A0A1M7UK36_9FIRM|nr:M24 family metallopeptidase [Desulfitobacterium chlororespirans]SHN83276.1 Xaa-Pro aminopeptidase [Desulfitobacterium chlororespirans DSM 11544]
MTNLGERFKCPIPNKELERRWSAIREAMKEQSIDGLIIQNHNQFLGGYIRYFLDIPAPTYGTTIFFPVNEEMTVISHGAIDGPAVPPAWATRGVLASKTYPIIQTLNYTDYDAPQAIVEKIKDSHYKKIGLVGLSLISAALYQYIVAKLPGVEIVDATDLVDAIKAVKSEDEIALIRKTVALHDHLAEAVPVLFRPGRKESEIRSELKRLAMDMGSEEQNIVVGTEANDKAFIVDPFFDNREIKQGDRMVILIEVNGPGGFYGEIARTWCLGEPSQDVLDAYAIATKAQKYIAGMLKPGAAPSDLFKANNDFLISHGYAPEKRYFAHGQGYDMVERPAFVPRETMLLKEGMFLAIHPTAANNKALAFSCDNYLITAKGAELLNKTPQIVFSV